MPTAPPHACGQPGCRELVPRGRARCAAHERAVDQRRGTAAQRGYGARWRAYRLQFLREHPLCVLCLAAGRAEASVIVDHIRDHKGDQVLFWDTANHRALCQSHHDARVDAGDFGRAGPRPPLP